MSIDISVDSPFYINQIVDVWTAPNTPYYGTLVGANNYFKTKLHTESWEDSDKETREKSLHEATRIIESLAFKGSKENSEQILFFPRATVDNGSIPQDIILASYEIALALLNGIDPDTEARNLSATAQGYAGSRTTYDRSFIQEHIRAGVPSAFAWSILRPYLCDPQAVRLSRGA